MAKLSHPNVVTVFEVGEVNDEVFVAMELVTGHTLRSWLETDERDWRTILRTFISAGRGLGAAHAAGMVHRDFKPENVLIDRAGAVKVTDFGLVGTTARPDESDDRSEDEIEISSDELRVSLTNTGALLGTPLYMAPEQATASGVDGRSDLYALSCMAFEMLTGVLPFDATHPVKMLNCHIREPAPSMRTKVPEAKGRKIEIQK